MRAHAERMGLITADKPESQEICFIPDDDHAAFVRRHRPEADTRGEIVDEHGFRRDVLRGDAEMVAEDVAHRLEALVAG